MRRPYFICLATLLSAAAISSATAQAPHAPEPPDPSAGLLPAQPISLTDLGAFRSAAANWRVAGGAAADRSKSLAFQAEPGTGVLVNTPTDAAKAHLFTTMQHGDLDVSLDVMLP